MPGDAGQPREQWNLAPIVRDAGDGREKCFLAQVFGGGRIRSCQPVTVAVKRRAEIIADAAPGAFVSGLEQCGDGFVGHRS